MVAQRGGSIPPPGSIPGRWRNKQAATVKQRFVQQQRHLSNENLWKPHVINRCPRVPRSPSLFGHKDLRSILGQVLAGVQQEFIEANAMLQEEGWKFRVGLEQRVALLKQKMVQLGAEIHALQ